MSTSLVSSRREIAAAAAVKEGLSPSPEVMIPLIGTKAELDQLRILVDEVARRVIQETGRTTLRSDG